MKKLLIILGSLFITGTSTTSLVACNKQYSKKELEDLKEKNNLKTKDGILEWIAPQHHNKNHLIRLIINDIM